MVIELTENIEIRLAIADDFEAIYAIWLDGVENSFNRNVIEKSVLKQKFLINFQKRLGIFNYWVAVIDHEILGWQSLIKTSYNPFRENTYAESSTYISRNCRCKGVGKMLIGYVIKQAELSQLEYVVGFISVANNAARKITRETGWVEIGEIPLSLKGDNSYPKVLVMRPV